MPGWLCDLSAFRRVEAAPQRRLGRALVRCARATYFAGMRSESMPTSPIASAAIVVLTLVVLGMGLMPFLAVIALTCLLLCHPMVRIFLEFALPSHFQADDSALRDKSAADGLRGYASTFATRSSENHVRVPAKERMTLSTLPPPLQGELRHILTLVRRDFIQYWYDPITFGNPEFPSEAIASAEHLLAQVALRLEQYSRVTIVRRRVSLTIGYGALPHSSLCACYGAPESERAKRWHFFRRPMAQS